MLLPRKRFKPNPPNLWDMIQDAGTDRVTEFRFQVMQPNVDLSRLCFDPTISKLYILFPSRIATWFDLPKHVTILEMAYDFNLKELPPCLARSNLKWLILWDVDIQTIHMDRLPKSLQYLYMNGKQFELNQPTTKV